MPDPLPDRPAELVFVYGTYRRSASNEARMKGVACISQAMIRGRLLKVGGLPVLVVEPEAETWVRGDLFRTDGLELEAFREYEGLVGEAVDGRPCRLMTATVYPNNVPESGRNVKLWAWTEPMTGAEAIPSGDWLEAEYPGSPPLFTLVACACAGAMPVGIFVCAIVRQNQLIGGAALLMALLAPFAGWVAHRFARRRRERWNLIRTLVAVALWIECVSVVILVFSLIHALTQGVF
ncbi:gamma-glutamylcyclotransferase [Luteolibacter sp. Populi]|uniref:gamma-glutamylcyclotransferase family protein n=1 Tax=Luteolibacter sp. Populi TaxID=3230487 RepID=UPI0034664D5E